MSENKNSRAFNKQILFGKPNANQGGWLKKGLNKPEGKLPLFDGNGQKISDRTIQSCLKKGWAKPWFTNPGKTIWTVCKLTHLGKVVAQEKSDQLYIRGTSVPRAKKAIRADKRIPTKPTI